MQTEYKKDKTRLDILISEEKVILSRNYDNNIVIPTSKPLIDLLTVFEHPENYVLHIHDNRVAVKNKLSFKYN